MPSIVVFIQCYLITIFIAIYPADSLLIKLAKNDKNITKNSEYFKAIEAGYKLSKHEVVTKDGYILQLFRLINEDCARKRNLKRPPVLLIHGLLESSDIFLDLGPGNSLGYILAATCFDVWLGNIRGNSHGRAHVSLDPDKDEEFWKFSIDEMGFFDIPAIVDYVIKETNSVKVNYIGFSQGCGTFYIMCSEKFGYCDKVNLKISIAPATRHLNTKSVMFRSVCEIIERNKEDLKRNGIFEVFADGGVSQDLVKNMCKEKKFEEFCFWLIKIFDSDNYGSIKRKTIKVLFEHFPAGTSVQNMARYGQSLKSRHFLKFNYGFDENLRLYGKTNPPKFNLSAVNVPVVVLYGNNDGIVDRSDVKWLIGKLPNVVEEHEIDHSSWTHLDNVYSRFIPELLAPKIIESLDKYS